MPISRGGQLLPRPDELPVEQSLEKPSCGAAGGNDSFFFGYLHQRKGETMGKRLGVVVVMLLSVLLPAYAAELDLASDPLWKALVLDSPVSGEPVPGAVNLGTEALCTANCGTTTVSCSTSGTCTAVDRNCSAGQRGYAQCGTTKTYCPSLCPVNNCGSNGIC